MPPVLSVRDLAHRLGTSVQRLREIALELDHGMQSHYTFWSKMNPKSGKVPHFRTPKPELMQLQSRIKVAILDPIGVSDCAHGAVRGRSPYTNASQHLGQHCVVTIDVRGFFPHVRHYMVYRLFRHELGFGTEVASILTRLSTLHAQLPQGAPSSPGIANLLMASAIDVPVSLRAREMGATNTRFLDDFAFSGSDPASLINDAARALSRRRLPVWRRTTKLQGKPKLKIMRGNQPQQVTGLNVNAQSGPSVPRAYRDGVQTAIHQLSAVPDVERERAARSILGRIRYVEQTNRGAARRLRRYLARQTVHQSELSRDVQGAHT